MRGDLRAADDNPAGRLFNVLHKARFIQKSPSALDAWVEILLDKKRDPEDLDDEKWGSSELREVIIRLADLHRLLDEVIEQTQNHGIQIEMFSRPLESLRHAMAPGTIDGSWDNAKNKITEEGLISLGAISELLSRIAPDATVPTEQLDALLKEVNDLIETLLKSDGVDDTLRSFAITQLRKIREAIELYHLRGPIALRDALESIIGATYLTPVESEDMPEEDRKLLGKFKKVIDSFHQMATYSGKVKEIAEKISPLVGYLLGS